MRRRPLSGRAQPRFQQPRRKGGQTRQVQPPARRLKRPAGSRRDLETRFGGAGNGAGPPKSAAMNKQGRRAARPCRKQQTARSGEAIMARRIPHFADHDRQRAAFERLFHRPQQGWRIGRADEDEPARAEPMRGKSWPIKSARLARAKILADQQRRLRTRRGRGEPRRQGQSETHRRRPVARLRGRDLVQSIVGQPAAQRPVEGARQRKPQRRARRSGPGMSLDSGDGAA
jgi:hypothetical protein